MADDLDSLIKDIAYSDRLPAEAMREAMAHAEALAPRIEALARRCVAQDYLYPTEGTLLLRGLAVLAAARERAIWPAWLELLTLPDANLEDLLGEDCAQTIAAVTLGLVDDDVGAVAALIDDRATGAETRGPLMAALARLMCEGRYPRQAFVDLIDRLAQRLDDSGNAFELFNIGHAIVLGGLGERAELLEHVFRADRDAQFWREIDKEGERKDLAAAAQNPGDPARFDDEGIAAPREPADAMRWLKRVDASLEPAAPDAHPLSWRERELFTAFLKRTGAAMTFEEIDGFLHALAVGPDLVLPSEYLPRIFWGGGQRGARESLDETRQALSLLRRHWNVIARRVHAVEKPYLWLEPHEGCAPGEKWSRGFLAGAAMRRSLWDALPEKSDAALSFGAIVLLDGRDLDEDFRSNLLAELPYNVTLIHQYWRALRDELMENAGYGMRKTGRNEPCPCGSGKKWKKCCGVGVTVH